jgi:hypothetical protein
VQPTSLRDLTDLVYEYGPFAFSILFLYSISRWAYKRYDEASKEDPPNSAKQSSTKLVYLMSFVAGLALVAVSVAWWFVHHPLYVVRGEIRGLDHNTRVSSTQLYFLDRPHVALRDDDLPVHDEQFVALSEHPFDRMQRFSVDFSKNQATHDQLVIECGPDDGGNVFTPGLKDGRNTLDRMSYASSPFDWIEPKVVYAQQSMPAQLPPYRLKPSSPVQPKDPPVDPSAVVTLQDPISSVGAKILALRKLQGTDPQTMATYFRFNGRGEPFAATILDLTRHSDPELAYDARALAESSVFEDYLQQILGSKDPGTRQVAQSVLTHMDPEQAARLTKDSGITTKIENRALVPTNFPDGDRYFLEIHWVSNDKKQVDCLADFFASSLDEATSEAKEKAVMRNSSQRLIYSAYPEWVVPAAGRLEKCGAKVSFVRPSAKAE